MKKVIVSICTLVLCAATLGASTFAWFSMNRSVTATGMKVTAKSTESLVISTEREVGTDATVSLASAAPSLVPATFSGDWTHHTTGLKALGGGSVNAATGGVTSPEYVDAISGNNFKDFVVYIASSGGRLYDQEITVEFLDVESLIAAYVGKLDTRAAVSVEFFSQLLNDQVAANKEIETVAVQANYKGVLTLANPNAKLVVYTGDIPKNGTNTDSVCVVMRVYFDGAAKIAYEKATGEYNEEGTYYTYEADGTFKLVEENKEADFAKYYVEASNTEQHYVYTDHVDTANAEFGVKFTAKEGN